MSIEMPIKSASPSPGASGGWLSTAGAPSAAGPSTGPAAGIAATRSPPAAPAAPPQDAERGNATWPDAHAGTDYAAGEDASAASQDEPPRSGTRTHSGRGSGTTVARTRAARNGARNPARTTAPHDTLPSFGTTLARTRAGAAQPSADESGTASTAQDAQPNSGRADAASPEVAVGAAPSPAALDAALALIAQQLAAAREPRSGPASAAGPMARSGVADAPAALGKILLPDVIASPGAPANAPAQAGTPTTAGASERPPASPPPTSGMPADEADETASAAGPASHDSWVPASLWEPDAQNDAGARTANAQDPVQRDPMLRGASHDTDDAAPDTMTAGDKGGPLLDFLASALAQARDETAVAPRAPLDLPRPESESAVPRHSGAGTDVTNAALATAVQAGVGPGAPAGRTTVAGQPTLRLSTPLGAAGWAEELGARISWAAHQGIGSASLQIAPEHLGPVEVKIEMRAGSASVWFGAAQPETRAALQQALPTLHTLFAGSGLLLADAGVSREPPRGQVGPAPAPPRGTAPAASQEASSAAAVRRPLGLVDTFA